MNRTWVFLLVALCLGAAACPTRGAAPLPKPEPLKGAVTQGVVLTCDRQGYDFYAHFQPLGGRSARKVSIAPAVDVPTRWTLSQGALWINSCVDRWLGEGPKRYELAELLKGRSVTNPGGKDYGDRFPPGFAPVIAVDALRVVRSAEEGFRAEWHYDYVPDGRFGLKLLMLANIDLYARHDGPRWSLACSSIRARWNDDPERLSGWEIEGDGWVKADSIDVAFREPFQALSRGDDFYFLTASGKLYRAPKPVKGTHRKMVPVWDDPRSRIVAHLTDADKDRTFLFLERGPKGVGGPCVFELADGVRLRDYDAIFFRPGDDGPVALRRVVGYARVLTALGYIDDRRAEKK